MVQGAIKGQELHFYDQEWRLYVIKQKHGHPWQKLHLPEPLLAIRYPCMTMTTIHHLQTQRNRLNSKSELQDSAGPSDITRT